MNFRNLRHGQTCVDHLLDAPRALRVAQVALLVAVDDMVHDAVDVFDHVARPRHQLVTLGLR